MKYIKRYSALVLSLVLSLSVAVVPAHAATATSKTTFWGALAMAADNALESYFGLDTDGLFQKVVGLVSDNVCSDSPDGKHHGEVVRGHLTSDGKYSGGFGGGSRANHYVVHCSYCGDYFELSDAVLDTAYQEHVSELPAPAVTSEGKLYWSPSHSYIENVAGYSVNGGCAHSSYNGTAYASVTCNDSLHTFLITATNAESTFRSSSISFGYSGIAPVDGTYSIVNGAAWVASVDGSDASDTWTTSDFLSRHYSSGSAVSIVKNGSMGDSWYSSINGTYYAPTLQVVPDSSLLNSGGYVTDGRTTNYNFELGDSTTVFNNVSNVFNETNNTYYNPITNNSYTVNNWSYDYSDRSYTVNYTTVDESETTIDNSVSITYGDEYVTIVEGDAVSGDKITYNISYYYSYDDGEGGGSGGDSSDDDSLFGKLGELLGTVVNGILGGVKAFLSKVFDMLISLAEMIGEKFARIVELVLGWFDDIPEMFGGFLDFLSAIFPYIPADLMLLLTFGLAAVIFIAIIKALRR